MRPHTHAAYPAQTSRGRRASPAIGMPAYTWAGAGSACPDPSGSVMRPSVSLTMLNVATLDVLPLVSVTVSYTNSTTAPGSHRHRVASQTVEARRAQRRGELRQAATRPPPRGGAGASKDAPAARAGGSEPVLCTHLGA